MLKNKLLNVLILSALSAPGLAFADDAPVAAASSAATAPVVTSNVALVTNYLYRGISQSGGNPAIQGGFDYSSASGFYIGTWGSSISWLSDEYTTTPTAAGAQSAGLELDTYLGFKNSFATDYSYDVGYLRYNYPGHYATGATKADTDEIYALIGYKWLTAKYSYALSNLFGAPNTTGSNYFDLSASYALGDSGFTVGAHYGIQSYQGSGATVSGNSLTYRDYKVSINKDMSGYVVGLTWNNTNATPAWTNPQGYQEGQSVIVASLLRTF
jgi:uncharacterized protein (TIGR02001 family)